MIHIFTALIATLVMLYASNLFAGKTNDIINRERLRRDKIVKELLKNNESFTNYKKISIQKMPDYQEIIETIKNKRVVDPKTNGDIKDIRNIKNIKETEKATKTNLR